MKIIYTLLGCIPWAMIFFAVKWIEIDNKKFVNPLTKKTLRPPGHTLGLQLGEKQLDIIGPFFFVNSSSVVILMLFATGSEKTKTAAIFFLLAIVVTLWGIYKICKLWKEVRKIRLGYECELAVGQELNQLMLQGFRVFHDIQFDKFNIDHVVVGTGGVFAVETKGRSKLRNSRGNGKEEYNLTYENGVLIFPGWQEDEPAKQAERQAKHLGDWLSGAVGFSVKPVPVLVLPGWFVNLKGNPTVPALAIGAIPSFFSKYKSEPLNQQQITQIAFQLENKVRDI